MDEIKSELLYTIHIINIMTNDLRINHIVRYTFHLFTKELYINHNISGGIFMKDYEKKEMHVLDNIADTVAKLDVELGKLDSLEEDSKKHNIKKWYAEKKAIHEIKHILHEVGKYEKYNENEMKDFANYFESFGE